MVVRMTSELSKEKMLDAVRELPKLYEIGSEWQVSSNSDGCPEGYTKVYLRRKRVERAWRGTRFTCISECLSDEEAEELKAEIKRQLKEKGLAEKRALQMKSMLDAKRAL
jgi:hypothetical protein